MLSGKGNKNEGEKNNNGLISITTTLHMQHI